MNLRISLAALASSALIGTANIAYQAHESISMANLGSEEIDEGFGLYNFLENGVLPARRVWMAGMALGVGALVLLPGDKRYVGEDNIHTRAKEVVSMAKEVRGAWKTWRKPEPEIVASVPFCNIKDSRRTSRLYGDVVREIDMYINNSRKRH